MDKKFFSQIQRLLLDKFTFTYSIDKNAALYINYGLTGSAKCLLYASEEVAAFLKVLRHHKNLSSGNISRQAPKFCQPIWINKMVKDAAEYKKIMAAALPPRRKVIKTWEKVA